MPSEKTEGLEVVAYMSYTSGAVYRADDHLTEKFGVPPGAAPLIRQSDALALAEAARERVDELERLLSLALPVARAAIRNSESEAQWGDHQPEKWSREEYDRADLLWDAVLKSRRDLEATVCTLSPEAREEILKGDPK